MFGVHTMSSAIPMEKEAKEAWVQPFGSLMIDRQWPVS
jgi:hypothetical protein